jgi:hypothetical protein
LDGQLAQAAKIKSADSNTPAIQENPTATPESDTTTTATDTKSASVGKDVVTQDSISFTLETENIGDTIPYSENGGEFSGKKTDGSWVSVKLHETNNSKDKMDITHSGFQLVDQVGRKYDASAWYLCDDDSRQYTSYFGIQDVEIKPDIQCTNRILFEVSKNSNAFYLNFDYTVK